MGSSQSEIFDRQAINQILGYLNFSSGTEDQSFLANLNALFESLGLSPPDASPDSGEPTTAMRAIRFLENQLESLAESDSSFENTQQASSILELVGMHVIPSYQSHHQDLLFHQPADRLINSFFLGKIFQATLQQGAPWNETDRVTSSAIASLNNFIGHRQVATLESQKIEPYENEWVAPIPIFIKGIGAATGRYQQLVEIALQFIRESEPSILRSAYFDLDRMEELAIDPRAYDFDHPINKRPNHQFGQWDEHQIDHSGYFNRFIIQQVTLDALLERVDATDNDDESRDDELLVQAGAALAGTMLMASGISGNGPGVFTSETSLSTILPEIADFRDQFYKDLLERLPDDHRKRLEDESKSKQQPFGAVRQHLNAQLARRRASQLVNCRLASIFARMGFSKAAEEQSQIVPVASARTLCQIDCLLSSSSQLIKAKKLSEAFSQIPRVISLLKRGVQCGAIVDPWNIIGFEANFSLFQAHENTVPDHRAYELVELVERILGLCSQLWSEAAAVDELEMCANIRKLFSEIVDWWRKYAAHEVMVVDAVDPDDIFQAAEHVARALNLWHKGGAEAGNIKFWGQHAAMFDSAKAYALVIDALMQRSDYQTSTALMVHWLSQADRIRLQQGDSSFHNLIWRWISEQKDLLKHSDCEQRELIWNRIRKFHDFIEANANQYWDVPQFNIGRSTPAPDNKDIHEWPHVADEHDSDDPDNDIFKAAYEDVTYQDTTDDGVEGSIFEGGADSNDELEAEVDRVIDRLEFLATLAGFWSIAATVPLPTTDPEEIDDSIRAQLKKRRAIVSNWIDQATRNRTNLDSLMQSVFEYPLPKTGVDQESMVQYDRHRLYKDSLLERIIASCVQTENAIRMLVAMGSAIDCLVDGTPVNEIQSAPYTDTTLASVFASILLKSPKKVLDNFDAAIASLTDRSLLYVPLSRGGEPNSIVEARVLQSAIRDLLASLPMLGLILETHKLTEAALAMERNHKIAHGAVTEFDDLFQVAYTSLVKCLIHSTQLAQQQNTDSKDKDSVAEDAESTLFDCIDMLTESMLIMWLSHSRTLRLTVLEKVNDREKWDNLVKFIQRYGGNLFTQYFLNVQNIRGILHQGVDVWLQNVQQSPSPLDFRLFDELDTALPRKKAIRFLTLVLEAVYENFNEYRDYNTTTTQSDRGDLLYIVLDFLRLRGRYDRVCWNLKPVIWAHDILVRNGQDSVASMWRKSLTEKVGPEANKFLDKLQVLRKKYSIQMDTIGRRLDEKFSQPMQIDRLRSLVQPAMDDSQPEASQETFKLLQQDTQSFCKATAGVGVDLPSWLAALENEVAQQHLPLRLRSQDDNSALIEMGDISIDDLREQLEMLPRRQSK